MSSIKVECPVCLENFTSSGEMLPYVLCCGHSLCLKCLNRVSLCPLDRERIPSELPRRVNFTLVELLGVIEGKEREREIREREEEKRESIRPLDSDNSTAAAIQRMRRIGKAMANYNEYIEMVDKKRKEMIEVLESMDYEREKKESSNRMMHVEDSKYSDGFHEALSGLQAIQDTLGLNSKYIKNVDNKRKDLIQMLVSMVH
jgi:hypothetical protein